MGKCIYGIIYDDLKVPLKKERLILILKKKLMTRIPVLLTATMAFWLTADAQYYYKDLISNRQLVEEMNKLKEQKVRSVSVKSYEDDGSPSDGFFCEKTISKSFGKVETFTRSNVTGASQFISYFNKNGLLEKTIDSSAISVTTVVYAYDEKDRIKNIRSQIRSNDDDFTSEIQEDHRYEYNNKGQVQKLIRIKNSTDTAIVLFSMDDNENVSIEKDTKSGNSYYYYYDSKKRLTDIVHLNAFNNKMLPDYIFEYNPAGQVVQMTTTEEGSSYYYIWKFIYDNGLRIREKCFSKEKRLMGTIEYEYK